MAAQITNTESADPLPGPPLGSNSYASRLLNPLSHYGTAAVEDFEITEDDYSINPGTIAQNICFSQRVKNKLDIEWRCAVIVKLMGKPNAINAYTFMHSGLKRKWNPQGPWQLIDLPNDFYIVKFHLESDFNIALCGGPWILAGQTLVVQKWRPEFDPNTEKINHMSVWVRILGAPVRFFKDKVLKLIGKILGTVIKVDKLTLAQARGKFARICVEIDLQTPLQPFVEIEGVAYGVVYEGISLICFNCGCYGHAKANCPHLSTSNVEPHSANPNSARPQTMSNIELTNASSTADTSASLDTNLPNTDMEIVEQTEMTKSNSHGPWMLMSYKNRKANPTKIPANSAPAQSGSRFALLETFVESEDGALTEVQPTVVESLTNKKIQEPPIVSIWKKVQKKIDKNIPDTSKHAATSRKGARNAKSTTSQKKTLTDITNGKPVPRQYAPKFNMGNTSKQSSGKDTVNLKMEATPIVSHTLSLGKTQLPDSSTTVQELHPQVNIAAEFGNCPPESPPNLNSSCTAMNSSEGSTSNGQVCSVLTLINENDMIFDVSAENSNSTSEMEVMVDI